MPKARDIGFEGSVLSIFDFLTTEHGFALIGSDEYSAHYASDCVWLVISHGRQSYELSLDVARSANQEDIEHPYSMQALMRVTDPPLAQKYRAFTATDAGAVTMGLQRLAKCLMTYGKPALRCDEDFFASMARERRAAAEDCARKSRWKADSEVALEAMKQKDWRRVIEIYEPRGDALKASEQKRLDIARRHVEQ
jgi:hypothetical protein